ncbi:MAG: hypothetical protein AAGI37_12515 [Planctomycetota bacterium]
MTLLDEIEKLPEGMEAKQVAIFFERALASRNKTEAFAALYALADRQWHTYERLDSDISARVEAWLIANWDRGSLLDTQMLTSIVAHLGLVTVFMKMKQLVPYLELDTRNEVSSFIDEVGESIDDPYSGMSK